MNKIVKNALILTMITLISGLGLGLVYEITKEPIAQAQETAKKEAWQAVFPEASIEDFEPVELDDAIAEAVISEIGSKGSVNEVCVVKGGELGYVVTTTNSEGYGGDIQITVGIKADGTVNGVSILSISETAGLGMKATEPAFYEQYHGKLTDNFYVAKDGGNGEAIDALSGATITSRAVTNAVNAAVKYYLNAFAQ